MNEHTMLLLVYVMSGASLALNGWTIWSMRRAFGIREQRTAGIPEEAR